MLDELPPADIVQTATLELANVMELLPHELLQPLVMATAEAKSMHEIAAQLNISEPEVRNRVTRAISFCRRRLQHRGAFLELARRLYN